MLEGEKNSSIDNQLEINNLETTGLFETLCQLAKQEQLNLELLRQLCSAYNISQLSDALFVKIDNSGITAFTYFCHYNHLEAIQYFMSGLSLQKVLSEEKFCEYIITPAYENLSSLNCQIFTSILVQGGLKIIKNNTALYDFAPEDFGKPAGKTQIQTHSSSVLSYKMPHPLASCPQQATLELARQEKARISTNSISFSEKLIGLKKALEILLECPNNIGTSYTLKIFHQKKISSSTHPTKEDRNRLEIIKKLEATPSYESEITTEIEQTKQEILLLTEQSEIESSLIKRDYLTAWKRLANHIENHKDPVLYTSICTVFIEYLSKHPTEALQAFNQSTSKILKIAFGVLRECDLTQQAIQDYTFTILNAFIPNIQLPEQLVFVSQASITKFLNEMLRSVSYTNKLFEYLQALIQNINKDWARLDALLIKALQNKLQFHQQQNRFFLFIDDLPKSFSFRHRLGHHNNYDMKEIINEFVANSIYLEETDIIDINVSTSLNLYLTNLQNYISLSFSKIIDKIIQHPQSILPKSLKLLLKNQYAATLFDAFFKFKAPGVSFNKQKNPLPTYAKLDEQHQKLIENEVAFIALHQTFTHKTKDKRSEYAERKFAMLIHLLSASLTCKTVKLLIKNIEDEKNLYKDKQDAGPGFWQNEENPFIQALKYLGQIDQDTLFRRFNEYQYYISTRCATNADTKELGFIHSLLAEVEVLNKNSIPLVVNPFFKIHRVFIEAKVDDRRTHATLQWAKLIYNLKQMCNIPTLNNQLSELESLTSTSLSLLKLKPTNPYIDAIKGLVDISDENFLNVWFEEYLIYIDNLKTQFPIQSAHSTLDTNDELSWAHTLLQEIIEIEKQNHEKNKFEAVSQLDQTKSLNESDGHIFDL